MNDLVERYVRQVGRYLPKDERKEIENELRSLISDQLDDRYKGAPTKADVVEVLAEFGEPRRMAASYGREQYLIGPELYPILIWVLQRGWVLIPVIVVLFKVTLALVTAQEATLLGLFLETLFLVAQAVFIFTGIVVLLFAVIQYTGVEIDRPEQAFNPLDLPPADDGAAVDRADAAFSMAFDAFGALILFYFLRVGGLTLRFNLSDPGDVIPVPAGWLVVLIITSIGQILTNLAALRRGRWSVGLLLMEFVLKVVGVIGGYMVIFQPLFDWLFAAVPALATLPFAGRAPEIAAVLLGFIILVDTFSRLIKVVWGGRPVISVDPAA
ncbi:MAG: hypothetical protein R6X18_11695 [Chloroflexota bacterium]|jgi:hypothetical protein